MATHTAHTHTTKIAYAIRTTSCEHIKHRHDARGVLVLRRRTVCDWRVVGAYIVWRVVHKLRAKGGAPYPSHAPRCKLNMQRGYARKMLAHFNDNDASKHQSPRAQTHNRICTSTLRTASRPHYYLPWRQRRRAKKLITQGKLYIYSCARVRCVRCGLAVSKAQAAHRGYSFQM